MKTFLIFKSIIDGVFSYILWYLWTAFLIWLGFYLLNIINLTYLQSLGSVLIIRQFLGLIKVSTTKHLKTKEEI